MNYFLKQCIHAVNLQHSQIAKIYTKYGKRGVLLTHYALPAHVLLERHGLLAQHLTKVSVRAERTQGNTTPAVGGQLCSCTLCAIHRRSVCIGNDSTGVGPVKLCFDGT